jgi:nucleoside-diphosphate-sugar epimerase
MKETSICKPRTQYELTKHLATCYCKGYYSAFKKPIVTIRPFSVYGNHEPAHRFIPTLYNCFENNIEPSISEGTHDFIYIDDFISNLINVMFSNRTKAAGDIVNFGTGIKTSNYEVFDIFKEIYNYNLQYKQAKQLRVFDNNNWVADMDYAISRYDFQFSTHLKNGIKKYIQIQRQKNT